MSLAADSYKFYTFSALPGIVIAAALYPPTAICLLALTFAFGFGGQNPADELIGMALIGAFTGSYIGFFIGFASGLFAIGIVSLFNWSIGHQLSPSVATSVAGGLAGFLPTSVILWDPSFVSGSPSTSEWLVLIAIGPVLATLFGQTGARFWEQKLVRKSVIQPSHPGYLRFGIRNIIALTLWCSCSLVVSRWLGMRFLGIVLAWIILQSLLLGMALFINRFVWRSQRTGHTESQLSSTVQHES